MITVEDVRFELNNEDLDETRILKTIKRAQMFIRGYTNNPLLFVQEDEELDEILLYLVASSLNEDVKGRQGLSSEGIGGVSFSFINDLPNHLKRVLYKNTRARTI